MSTDSSDDELQIMEQTCNPNLLVEGGEPVRIHIDHFSTLEALELMETVRKYGGELSNRANANAIILSHPKLSARTKFNRFHVDWLHDTIRYNKVQHLPDYLLDETDIVTEPEVRSKAGGVKNGKRMHKNIVTQNRMACSPAKRFRKSHSDKIQNHVIDPGSSRNFVQQRVVKKINRRLTTCA